MFTVNAYAILNLLEIALFIIWIKRFTELIGGYYFIYRSTTQ